MSPAEMNLLYTFIAEYKGGTYISQIEAESLGAAVSRWRQSEVAVIAKASKTDVSNFRFDSLGEGVAIDGCQNVWCFSNSVDDCFLLINVVSTVG